jgi:cation diffusion facilitator family transporter
MRLKRISLGYLAGGLSVIINIILFLVKYWVGIEFQSISMEADAWHTLSDTLTSLVVILGFWISSIPPDKHHPFGHGRAEAIGALIIGTLLAVAAFTFFTRSLERLQQGESAMFGDIAIYVFLASVIIKETLAQYSLRMGKKIQSEALIADGWHHRTDAIASGVIVLGAVLGGQVWWIDGAMGVGVSCLILYTVYSIFKRVIGSLLGEHPGSALKETIETLIETEFPEVSHVHHLHIHRYGDHIEATLHIMLPATMNLQEAHDIAQSIEKKLRDHCQIEATVHMDPRNTENP